MKMRECECAIIACRRVLEQSPAGASTGARQVLRNIFVESARCEDCYVARESFISEQLQKLMLACFEDKIRMRNK